MGKRRYIVSRLIQIIIVFLLMITVVFLMFRLLPGDPTAVYINTTELSLEVQKALTKQFGLDKSLFEQYLHFIKNLFQGNLGISFHYGVPVVEIIAERFWNTIILMGVGIGIAYIMGIIIGALSAWKRGSKFEMVIILITLSARSAPQFLIGILLIMFFSMTLGFFPLGGIREVGVEIERLYQKYLSIDFLYHLILPALTIGIYFMGTPFVIMRSSMLEVLNEDYIEIAQAKGLKPGQVIFKHAMRNSLLPVISMLTVMVSFIIGGQVMVETVFRWPGIGKEIVTAVNYRDYPVAQGIFMMMGVVILFMNLIIDILYTYLDPRVKYV